MSWHFSQVLVEEFLQAKCLDGELSALWKSTPFAHDESCSGKMKDTCHRSRYGTMYVPLMDANGKMLLTWFLEAFPAKISRSPEKEPVSTGPGAVFGVRWRESFLKLCPNSFSWKTHRHLFTEVLPESSVTLPAWGIMQDGVVWEGRTWGVWSTAKDYGLSLRRPTAQSWKAWTCRNISSLVRKNHLDFSIQNQFARLFHKMITPESNEVLMLLPKGWSGSKPLATASVQNWLAQRGNVYLSE